MIEPAQPMHLAHGGGTTYRARGGMYALIAPAVTTSGAFSLWEATNPPGTGVPPHIHSGEDEAFYILTGRYTFWTPAGIQECGPGEFLSVPRGMPHGFQNEGPTDARALIVQSPGGPHELYFAEAWELVDDPAHLPPESEPNFAKIKAAAERAGIELLPPPVIADTYRREPHHLGGSEQPLTDPLSHIPGGQDMMQTMPTVCGVHHVKIPVRDPAVSRDFYCRVLGFEEEISFEEDGVLMGVALRDPRSGLRYAVRQDPDRAAALARFDPVALAVTTRAELDAWVTRLDEHGIEHGPIMNGHIGWVVGFSDPDGIEVRLYTLERPEGA